MMYPALSFLTYFLTACALLSVFVIIYVRTTPYNEFELIGQNNTAAAVSLLGAVIGFAIAVGASIYFTHSLLEMIKWAGITCLSQLLLFTLMRRYARAIERGDVAPAIFLAALSISLGIFAAASIS